MTRDRARWSAEQVLLLLNRAIEEKAKYNWNQFGLTREGWRNIYPYFPQYSQRQVTNKFEDLKRRYRAWMEGQAASGLGRDKHTGGIHAEPEYWETQYGSMPAADNWTEAAETSNAAAECGTPPPFLTELHALFGDRNTNTGTYMSAGGIGSQTPPHVMRQHEYSGPASYHSGSKRARGDQEATSPHKKCCDVGDYLGKISDSIAARSSSRDRIRTCEQEEIREAMQLLRADGVPIPSDLYFTALESFQDSVSRTEFLNMDGPEVRIAWLNWLMQRNKK